MRKAFLLKTQAIFLLLVLKLLLPLPAAAQQANRPFLESGPINALSPYWQVYDKAAKKLAPYIPQEHSGNRAFYQRMAIHPDYPFTITFPAHRGLTIFLNNRLLFTADSAANYTIDLTDLVLLTPGKNYLLTVWSPNKVPDLAAFTAEGAENSIGKPEKLRRAPAPEMRPVSNQNAFIIFLLVIAFILGNLRTNFSSDFNSVLRLGNIFQGAAPEEGFLAKPVASWPGILFVLAFSLSFSVLVVAIQISGLNAFIFNRFFQFSNSEVIAKIIFNSGIVFLVVLGRYLFLNVIAYIFSLPEVVSLQYREFLRGILFMGLFLPVIILFYLIFNQAHPQIVSQTASLVLVMLLIVIVIRVIIMVNKKESILNLHLFSYLCATEIIPLTVVLKLILFNS